MTATTTRRRLIAGNWKMNTTPDQATTLLTELASRLAKAGPGDQDTEIAVFPPFTSLGAVQEVTNEQPGNVTYGGQDLSQFDAGAYTGDISGHFLSALGCIYVLVGHSERRTIHAESDETVAAKVNAAYRHNLTPVLCVGEPLEIRQSRTHVEFTLAQLRAAITHLNAEQASSLVVAYEPVWAIGTGEVAGPEDAQEMCAAIRAELSVLFTEGVSDKIRILYGGSVKGSNAAAILNEVDVDGALVGGASLDPEEFSKISKASGS